MALHGHLPCHLCGVYVLTQLHTALHRTGHTGRNLEQSSWEEESVVPKDMLYCSYKGGRVNYWQVEIKTEEFGERHYLEIRQGVKTYSEVYP